MNRIAFSLVAVLLLAPSPFLASTASARPRQAPEAAAEQPVAVIHGEPIYEKDYHESIRPETYNIQLEAYNLELQTLRNLIDTRLLKEEAEAQGITQQELVEREVLPLVPEPDEQEVERRFAQSLFSGQGARSREDIRNDIKQERVNEARETYFSTLRERAGVEIYLPRPRMEVEIAPSRIRGNVEAPITMVQFSDFECLHCMQAYATVNSVLRRYEGKVALAFLDFPLIQAEASGLGADAASLVGSADAARCAHEQGKFWEYHDVLFESEGRSEYDFREYANQLGLDVEPFSTCLTSGRYAEAIKADFADGLSLGIGGTPYFFINGIPFGGARPECDFVELLEEELARLEGPLSH